MHVLDRYLLLYKVTISMLNNIIYYSFHKRNKYNCMRYMHGVYMHKLEQFMSLSLSSYTCMQVI